jgi:hypothetical protein
MSRREHRSRARRRLAVAGGIVLALVLPLAPAAHAGVARTTEWTCLVPLEDGSVEEVVFVSVPEAARHGIDVANVKAGTTFKDNFGETCTVR